MNGINITRNNKKSHRHGNRYMLGNKLCSFRDCKSHIKKPRHGALCLFSFPVKDTERCSIWITNSGREEFRYLTPKELANKRICELHFEEFMFSNFFKTNLKKNAVPNQFDKVTPEMFRNNDDVDSNDEDESGIASESSSNHNNRDYISALSNTDNVIEDGVIDHSFEKNTKFHNLPPQTMQNDFYFQTCSESAEETNNSMPEPLDGELPLFVQQDSVVSLVDDPANSEHFEPLTKRRKRDKDDEDLSEQIRGAVKDLKNITSLLSNDDEFDLFGKIVALQLKKMSLCTALDVQAKIQSLLSQHRISDIQKEHLKSKAVNKLLENHKKKDIQNKENGDFNEEQETTESPQLSLTCASENSDFSENN